MGLCDLWLICAERQVLLEVTLRCEIAERRELISGYEMLMVNEAMTLIVIGIQRGYGTYS